MLDQRGKQAAVSVAMALMASACVAVGSTSTTVSATTLAITEGSASATTEDLSTTTIVMVGLRDNPLKIVDDDFIDRQSGEVFVVRGANYFNIVPGPSGSYENRTLSPLNFRPDDVERDFRALADRGYNTVRVFLECNGNPGCIGSTVRPGLNGDYLDVIVELMNIAVETDMMLLFTSNDLPDDGGYRTISARDDSRLFPGYRNSDFLTESGRQAMVKYWTDLMVGLVERKAPFEAVLGWSILNEHWLFRDQPPLSLATGTVTIGPATYDMADPGAKRAMVIDATRQLIEEVAAVIRGVHPTALVTMGFFVPDFPNPTAIGGDWYVDTAPLVESSDLDFFDFHFYANSDISVDQAARNFGVDDSRPVIMGEYGVFVHDMPTSESLVFTVLDHMAKACAAGFDGWIYWGYQRAPLDDATWSLTDEEGLLLDALAPMGVPDPCVAPADPNLAAAATVTVSASLPDQPGEYASDGTSRQWGSGADAPQWIELDLGSPAAVSSVRMTVAQYPAGRTVHRIEWASDDHVFSDSFLFDGVTDEGDVLVFDPPVPVELRFLRITTSVSPSWVAWREITVFGDRSP